MKEKISSDINLDFVFKCNDFSKLSPSFQNSRETLIFESSFWHKVFLSWMKTIIENDAYARPELINQKKTFSLGMEIITNKEIAHINQMWMQKNKPTDVLSFPIISEESFNELDFLELGDIFISVEMAIKQSLEYKHSLHREMLWLASHGFLHLLGWEHNNNYELDNMLNFQEYLISRLE